MTRNDGHRPWFTDLLHETPAPSTPPAASLRTCCAGVTGAPHPSKVRLVVMGGRHDHFHPLGEQRAETGAGLHHRIPVDRLLVAAPIDAAEIIRDREMGR